MIFYNYCTKNNNIICAKCYIGRNLHKKLDFLKHKHIMEITEREIKEIT